MKRRVSWFLNKSFIINTSIFALVVCGLLYFSVFAGISLAVEDWSFAQGVRIDGVDLSGMTYDQAEQAVSARASQLLSEVKIPFVYNDTEIVMDADDLGISLNYNETLESAFDYNRSEADTVAQRYNKTVRLSQGMDFESGFTVNPQRLQKAIEAYARRYNKTPKNAVAVFDKTTCEFSYTAERTGTKINTDKIYSDIIEMLNEKRFEALEVEATVLTPAVTEAMLRANTVQIAEYTTVATKHANRNINIQLMCAAVNGLEIKPGEILSLNELVGDRTTEKGFMPAPAIENGLIVDDIGGGICQLAGTLYNAALLGNMQIVERVRHTWPSDYLPIGQDSTLNWNNKDLKIKNTSDYSIFIYATMQEQNVIVKLYGQPLEEGMTIEIKNEIVQKIMPKDAEIRYTSELPNGVTQVAREAKPGYDVKVYRVYLYNNQVQKQELISRDIYPAIKKLIYIGKNTNNK